MKIVSNIAAFAAVAIVLQAVPASAQSTDPDRTASIGHRGGFGAQSAVLNWSGGRFSVQRLEYLDDDDIRRDQIADWVNANPEEVAELQRTIRANSALSSALRAKNVQIGNVIAVQRALNGGLTFFLR